MRGKGSISNVRLHLKVSIHSPRTSSVLVVVVPIAQSMITFPTASLAALRTILFYIACFIVCHHRFYLDLAYILDGIRHWKLLEARSERYGASIFSYNTTYSVFLLSSKKIECWYGT